MTMCFMETLLSISIAKFMSDPFNIAFTRTVRHFIGELPAEPLLFSIVFLVIIYYAKFCNQTGTIPEKMAILSVDFLIDFPMLIVTIIAVEMQGNIGQFRYLFSLIIYCLVIYICVNLRGKFLVEYEKLDNGNIDFSSLRFLGYQMLFLVLYGIFLFFV